MVIKKKGNGISLGRNVFNSCPNLESICIKTNGDLIITSSLGNISTDAYVSLYCNNLYVTWSSAFPSMQRLDLYGKFAGCVSQNTFHNVNILDTPADYFLNCTSVEAYAFPDNCWQTLNFKNCSFFATNAFNQNPFGIQIFFDNTIANKSCFELATPFNFSSDGEKKKLAVLFKNASNIIFSNNSGSYISIAAQTFTKCRNILTNMSVLSSNWFAGRSEVDDYVKFNFIGSKVCKLSGTNSYFSYLLGSQNYGCYLRVPFKYIDEYAAAWRTSSTGPTGISVFHDFNLLNYNLLLLKKSTNYECVNHLMDFCWYSEG